MEMFNQEREILYLPFTTMQEKMNREEFFRRNLLRLMFIILFGWLWVMSIVVVFHCIFTIRYCPVHGMAPHVWVQAVNNPNHKHLKCIYDD